MKQETHNFLKSKDFGLVSDEYGYIIYMKMIHTGITYLVGYSAKVQTYLLTVVNQTTEQYLHNSKLPVSTTLEELHNKIEELLTQY
jgi:hypothetical protein